MKVISHINQTEISLKISFYPRVAYLRSLNECLCFMVPFPSLNPTWDKLYRSEFIKWRPMCQFPLWSNRGRSLFSKQQKKGGKNNRIINCNTT